MSRGQRPIWVDDAHLTRAHALIGVTMGIVARR
jgi:hypothetical protein